MATGPAPRADARPVRRRRVFYIPGYDPFHPRRYRELYRKEGAAQAALSGYELEIKPKTTPGPYGWHVQAQIGDQEIDSAVEVLVWSDIVKNSMGHSILATYGAMLRTAWAYIGSGALFRLMRLRKGPVIAALYPVLMLLAQLGLALAIGHFAGQGLAALASYAPLGPESTRSAARDMLANGIYWVSLLGIAWWLLDLFRRFDNKFFVYYLMHDYSYSARRRGANPPELEARLAEFSDVVAAGLRSDVDEVLVVGHSSGAHLGVSLLADLVRAGRVPANGPALGFLSLGQVVPMVSFLPEARRLRRDLHDLCQSEALAWIDVTAPGDGCAFALCDPVLVSGVAPETGKRWPLVFSAAFTQSLSPARWKELRWRFFRLHFQYICAFDAPKDYDYFQITAGPQTLGTRYANRPASKSRIERAVSGYREMAP
ncbi:hypothetical protein [Primorskyibacter sp. S187A]|uniref:hypothetical protein n=1 Tax=Primorskyibacter sp. S187A TaxID=3415130 RepID=UPI003C7C0A9B